MSRAAHGAEPRGRKVTHYGDSAPRESPSQLAGGRAPRHSCRSRGTGCPEVPSDDPAECRGEALAVGARHVRPLGKIVALYVGAQLRVVLEVDPGSAALREQYVPGASAREHLVLIG